MMKLLTKDELTRTKDKSCQINTVLLSSCFATIVSRTGLWKQRLGFPLLLLSYNITNNILC